MRLALAITAIITTGPVVAEPAMPASAVMTQGMCAGLRAAGNADPLSPVVVTLERGDGSNAFFRCDPAVDGKWHPVIERTVRMMSVPVSR